MSKDNKKYKVLDLFAGAGGFSYGFSLVKDNENSVFEIVKAIEIDSYACETLRGHLENNNQNKNKIVYEADLTKDHVKEDLIKSCKNKVDIIIGGPPCQTFSLAGPSRSGSKKMREALRNDKRNILFKHYLELVKEINPKFVVFENVVGITSKDSNDISSINNKNKKVIELICDELKEMGYQLKNDKFKDQEYMILNAANYGVPQERKRVFIIANKLDKKNNLNPYPKIEFGEGQSKPHITVMEAIDDLPPLLPVFTTRSFKRLKKIDFIIKNYTKNLERLHKEICKIKKKKSNNAIKKLDHLINKEISKFKNSKANYEEVLRFINNANNLLKELRKADKYIKFKSRDLDSHVRVFKNYIKGKADNVSLHKARPHNLRDIVIFSLMKAGTTSAHFFSDNNFYSDTDLRKKLQDLYPYDSSKHVDTYVKHDPNKPSKTILAHLAKDGLRFIHPEQPRTFTPREAARLQSFPDDFNFRGPMISQYRQIGNAVPPLLAKAIGEAIYKKLKDE